MIWDIEGIVLNIQLWMGVKGHQRLSDSIWDIEGTVLNI